MLLTLFAVPLLWYWLRRSVNLTGHRDWFVRAQNGWRRGLFRQVESAAAQVPQESYYLDKLDTAFYQKYWNALEPDAMVFDLMPRARQTVFARTLRSNRSWYDGTA